jgi:uncharacterized protein
MPNEAGNIVAIYRYPIKGLSAERLDGVVLTPGECLPHDRQFAIALASTRFDLQHPEWLPKIHFAMLMRDEKLALLQTHYNAESGVLAITRNARLLLHARLTDAEECKLVGEFFTDFLGDTVNGPLRIVSAPGHAFADAQRKPNATTDKYVSLINHSSIAALETAMGATVDGEVDLGAARLRVVSPITRCAATQVNPLSAKRDLDIVAALGRAFGHTNMGVYAEVMAGGEIAVGDALLIRHVAPTATGRIPETRRKEWSSGTRADWAMEPFGLRIARELELRSPQPAILPAATVRAYGDRSSRRGGADNRIGGRGRG